MKFCMKFIADKKIFVSLQREKEQWLNNYAIPRGLFSHFLLQ